MFSSLSPLFSTYSLMTSRNNVIKQFILWVTTASSENPRFAATLFPPPLMCECVLDLSMYFPTLISVFFSMISYNLFLTSFVWNHSRHQRLLSFLWFLYPHALGKKRAKIFFPSSDSNHITSFLSKNEFTYFDSEPIPKFKWNDCSKCRYLQTTDPAKLIRRYTVWKENVIEIHWGWWWNVSSKFWRFFRLHGQIYENNSGKTAGKIDWHLLLIIT